MHYAHTLRRSSSLVSSSVSHHHISLRFVSLCVRNNRDLKRHPCYQAGAAEAFTNDNAPAPDLPLSPLAKPPATAMAEVPMWPPASEEEGGEEPAVRGSMKPE